MDPSDDSGGTNGGGGNGGAAGGGASGGAGGGAAGAGAAGAGAAGGGAAGAGAAGAGAAGGGAAGGAGGGAAGGGAAGAGAAGAGAAGAGAAGGGAAGAGAAGGGAAGGGAAGGSAAGGAGGGAAGAGAAGAGAAGAGAAGGGTIHSASEHGTVASHPARETQPFRVAPTTGTDVNTVSLDLVVVACLSLHDILFDFDSSFVNPGVTVILKELAGLRDKHKNTKSQLPPVSVFGHADPVGEDEYNKQLSGRRARAIYGLLTHDLGMWNALYVAEWSSKDVLKTMRARLGAPADTSRDKLFQDYMKLLFPTPLAKGDFLGKGASSKGLADFQGCSDFNPLIVLSTSENQTLLHSVRNARNQPDRRVVVFLYRAGTTVNTDLWPCPAATEGTAKCRLRFFAGPPPGDQRRKAGPVHKEFTLTKDTFACRFYDRMARLSPCEQPPPPPPPATIEFITDKGNDFVLDAGDPVTTFARMGLWDHAFTAPSKLNDAAAEANNFAGADSRRFYLRIRDSIAHGRVTAKWHTLDAAGKDFDVPADQTITLLETAANSGVFVSKALMLVTDSDDQHQSTNTGFPAGDPSAGEAAFGAANHRIRRAPISGSVEAVYTPSGARPEAKIKIPVFTGGPDARRNIAIQICVLRVAAGGAGVLTTDAASVIFTRDIRIITETYARLNIAVFTAVGAGIPLKDVVTVGSHKVVLIDPLTTAGFNVLNIGNAEEESLAAAFPAVTADTMRLFYVGRLSSGNRGEAWPDVDAAGRARAGTCFINAASSPTGPYSPAHELGHLLTNKSVRINGGHYNAPAAVPRLTNDQNLMRNGTSSSEGVLESKRLWDDPDADGVNQFTSIRSSHYSNI